MCRFCIACYANYNYSYNFNYNYNSNYNYNHKHNNKNKINIKYSYKRVRIFGRKMPRNPALFCLCVERPVEKYGESVEKLNAVRGGPAPLVCLAE